MAYDEGLMQRVEQILEQIPGFNFKKMFGGICFLLNGNMACGIVDDDLIVRVGKPHYEKCLDMPHAREFDMTGRPMNGWVMISYEGYESDDHLMDWVQYGIDTALSLPPK